MKSFRTVLTVILVALWPLATSHCRAEQIPALAFLHCGESEAAAPHEDAGCETDGCAVVESGSYKIEDHGIHLTGPVLLAVFTMPESDPTPPPFHHLADFPTVAAPELPVTWQFSSRTALPPRAPSAAS